MFDTFYIMQKYKSRQKPTLRLCSFTEDHHNNHQPDLWKQLKCSALSVKWFSNKSLTRLRIMFEDVAHTDLVFSFQQQFMKLLSKVCIRKMTGESFVSSYFMVINNKFELLQPTTFVTITQGGKWTEKWKPGSGRCLKNNWMLQRFESV